MSAHTKGNRTPIVTERQQLEQQAVLLNATNVSFNNFTCHCVGNHFVLRGCPAMNN